MINDNEIKELFYCLLDSLFFEIFVVDKFIILGDFNVRVGKDYEVWL